jgi:hypothetical protein
LTAIDDAPVDDCKEEEAVIDVWDGSDASSLADASLDALSLAVSSLSCDEYLPTFRLHAGINGKYSLGCTARHFRRR